MGIFSKLFELSSGPSPVPPSCKNWGIISLNISKGLEEMREVWFDECVKNIQRSLSNQEHPDIEVVNTHLEGKAELAIKAYQLYIVSGFLAQKSYISSSEGADFADLLYAQVCGTKIKEILAFFARYEEIHRKPERQIIRFCSDVAEHIMGDRGYLGASVLITPFIPSFVAMNQYVVASCFGDKKTAKELMATFQS